LLPPPTNLGFGGGGQGIIHGGRYRRLAGRHESINWALDEGQRRIVECAFD